MLSVVFIFAFAIVLSGIGWSVVGWLDRDRQLTLTERAIFSFVIGLYAIYFSVFTIAPFRLDSTSMWLVCGFWTLVSIPGLRELPWRTFGSNIKCELISPGGDSWLRILWLIAAALSLVALLQGLAPPNDFDSLNYHLTLPRYDIEVGRAVIAWERAQYFPFFPAMTSHLSRLALATMNDGVAQMLHGLLGIFAALATGLIVRRLGYAKDRALLAAILFLAIRFIVWQIGTAETDLPLGFFCALSLLAYLIWREAPKAGLSIMFGLVVGGAILTKYLGFAVAVAFGPLMLWDFIRRRPRIIDVAAGPVVAFVVLIPHMVRNFLYTENPLFPLFNSIFNPGQVITHADIAVRMVEAKLNFWDMALVPWKMFVAPMGNLDGMAYGTPYLLILAPLILLESNRLRRWALPFGLAVGYYLIWLLFMAHQARFLMPIIPILAAASAVGAALLWNRVRNSRVKKGIFIGLALILMTNQTMFVGIYALLRIPVAINLMNKDTYLTKTPTLRGAMYKTCHFIEKNLNPGRQYFSIIFPHSYYCPQKVATWTYFKDEARWWLYSDTPPDMSLKEFLRRSEDANFQYFIIPHASESRRNARAKAKRNSIDLTEKRFGIYLAPVLLNLKPLSEGLFSAVYDGRQVIAGLKALLETQKNKSPSH